MKNVKEIVIGTFKNDTEANKWFESHVLPHTYEGHRVIGGELQYGCKANGFAKTQYVIKVAV